jgi:hypothetical protein
VKEVARVSTADGYDSSCPQRDVELDVTSLLREAAAGNWPHVTIGLRSPAEVYWGGKEFLSEPVPEQHKTGPVIVVDYNTVPDLPSSLSMGTEPCTNGMRYIPTATPTLRARLTDTDGAVGQQVRGTFRWFTAGGTLLGTATTAPGAPGGTNFEMPFLDGVLADGQAYSWDVRTEDGFQSSEYTAPCQFTVDTTRPAVPPAVTSGVYPEHATGGQVDQTGAFTITANGVADVAGFRYGLNADTPDTWVAADRLGGSATVQITPVRPVNYLTVRSVDRANNPGPIRRYDFSANTLPGPVGYWPFFEGAGDTALDASFHGNDGTLRGNVTWTSERDGAVRFDRDGHFSTPGPVLDTQASFTVMAWVRLERNDSYYSVLSQDGTFSSGFDLQYSSFPAGWALVMPGSDTEHPDPPGVVLADTRPQVGVWTHLAGVYDHGAGQLRIYVNGRLAGTAAHRGNWSAQGALQIGRAKHSGFQVQYWPGDLDEVTVLDRVTSPREIRERMGCDCFGPGGQWSLDETAGTLAADSSGNGNTLALAEGAAWRPGRHGGGLHFDGKDDHAFTAGPVVRTNTSFTAAAWVKPDRGDAYVTALSQDGLGDSAFRVSYSAFPRSWEFVVKGAAGGETGVARTGAFAQVGIWTHLVAMYDADQGQLRLYVNGVLAASTAYRVATGIEGAFQVGRARGVDGGNAFWPGDVDDVRLLDRTASESEIRRIMDGDPMTPNARWRFEEGSGTHAADFTGNGHTLELWPGASWTTGQSGTGLLLDGQNGHAFAAGPVVRTDISFTATAWVRLDDKAGNKVAVSQDGVYQSGFRLHYEQGSDRWAFSLPKVDVEAINDPAQVAIVRSVTPPTVGRWTHLAGVYDATAGVMRLYVDGQLAGTQAHRGTWTARDATVIGRGKANGWLAEYFTGAIDDVRMLDHAATADEIYAISGIPPLPAQPLPGPYRIRSVHSNLCLTERTGNDSGYLYQADCAGQMPAMTLQVIGDGSYGIALDHPVHGPGCTGVPGGSTAVGAPLEDDYCGAGKGQAFRLEPVNTPLRGLRIRPVHSDLCVGITGDSAVAWQQAYQLACDPAAKGQVFVFDSR